MNESEIIERRTFLPDLCGIRALFGIVIMGELLAVMLTLASAGIGPSALDRLSLISLFTQWVALSAAAGLCLFGRFADDLSESSVAIASYALILMIAAIITELAWNVVNPLTGFDPIINIGHVDFFVRTLSISAIVGALVLRYFYVQHHWKRRTVSEARARLDALQARIRPHFFFNCMNTIASLTRTDPGAAERAVEDLADLFRASMGDARTLVSLEEEFELVRGYLNIETLRLGNRINARWQLDALPNGVRIPLLTLQPLVENAIYHGIEPLADGGVIGIDARRRGTSVEIAVSNPLGAEANSPHQGNKLALENVRQRLRANFGELGRLEITRHDDRYCAVITLPTQADKL